jgi:hypothetical protein
MHLVKLNIIKYNIKLNPILLIKLILNIPTSKTDIVILIIGFITHCIILNSKLVTLSTFIVFNTKFKILLIYYPINWAKFQEFCNNLLIKRANN